MYILLPFCNPSQCKKRLCKYRNVQACWQSFRLLLSLSSQHLCLRSCRRWWFSAPILFIAILVFITMKWRAKYISSLSILRRKISAILNEIATLKVQGILHLKCIFVVLKWDGSVQDQSIQKFQEFSAEFVMQILFVIVGVAETCVHTTCYCQLLLWFSWESCFWVHPLPSACSGVAVWKD